MPLVCFNLKYRLYYPAAQCAQRKVFVGGVIFIIIFLPGRDFVSESRERLGCYPRAKHGKTGFRALSGTPDSVAWFTVPLRALYVPLRRSLRALYHVPL